LSSSKKDVSFIGERPFERPRFEILYKTHFIGGQVEKQKKTDQATGKTYFVLPRDATADGPFDSAGTDPTIPERRHRSASRNSKSNQRRLARVHCQRPAGRSRMSVKAEEKKIQRPAEIVMKGSLI
jgi:hypothetical protein